MFTIKLALIPKTLAVGVLLSDYDLLLFYFSLELLTKLPVSKRFKNYFQKELTMDKNLTNLKNLN